MPDIGMIEPSGPGLELRRGGWAGRVVLASAVLVGFAAAAAAVPAADAAAAAGQAGAELTRLLRAMAAIKALFAAAILAATWWRLGWTAPAVRLTAYAAAAAAMAAGPVLIWQTAHVGLGALLLHGGLLAGVVTLWLDPVMAAALGEAVLRRRVTLRLRGPGSGGRWETRGGLHD